MCAGSAVATQTAGRGRRAWRAWRQKSRSRGRGARPGSGSDDGDEFAGKRQIRTGTSARDPARAGAAPGKEGLLTPISKWLWDEDK